MTANRNKDINKNHSRVSLSGISALFKMKADETPDTNPRGWQYVRAFTLIELLVVVLIIGILAAIALPQYQKAVLKSRFTQGKILANSLAEAEEIYYLANNTYTLDYDALDIQMPPSISSHSDDSQNTKTFSWGRCTLHHCDTCSSFVKCGVKEISYQIYFLHSRITPAQRWCVADSVDLTHISNKTCNTETGKTAPEDHYSDSIWKVWIY